MFVIRILLFWNDSLAWQLRFYHFRVGFRKFWENCQNRLAAKSAPPGDATFHRVFSGFCDEPPGVHGGPASRRTLELHNLTYFWCFCDMVELLYLHNTDDTWLDDDELGVGNLIDMGLGTNAWSLWVICECYYVMYGNQQYASNKPQSVCIKLNRVW